MLIKTIKEFQNYVPNVTGNKLPPLDAAEGEFILPILGETLYTALNTKYTTDFASLTADEKALLACCQAVLAPAAYYKYLPMTLGTISDAGLQQLHVDQGSKLFKWEYNIMREEFLKRAYAAQELLIIHLKLNKDKHPTWADSPYNDTDLPALLRDGSDLRAIISLQQPNRSFYLLRSIISDVTQSYIIPLISEAYYTVLNERIVADTLNADDKVILPKLRMALIRKVMATAGKQMNVRFSDNGFTIVQQIVDDAEEGRSNASNNHLDRFISYYDTEADAQSQSIAKYLNENASALKYPEYFESSVYQLPGTTTTRISNEGRGIFIA